LSCANGRGLHHLDRPWPLHKAVSLLAGTAPASWVLRLEPNEHSGQGIAGLDSAVFALLSEGVLRPQEYDSRALVPSPRPAGRRLIMRLSPTWAREVYDAARVWVTLSETSEKNWRTARSSLAPTVAEPPATPRQGRVAVRH
jgi:hypothetical protein